MRISIGEREKKKQKKGYQHLPEIPESEKKENELKNWVLKNIEKVRKESENKRERDWGK